MPPAHGLRDHLRAHLRERREHARGHRDERELVLLVEHGNGREEDADHVRESPPLGQGDVPEGEVDKHAGRYCQEAAHLLEADGGELEHDVRREEPGDRRG